MKIFLRVLFMVSVLVGFWVVDKVFRQKDSRAPVVHDFYFGDHAADAYDVIAFGPSYVYCTVNPVQLYRDTGLRSYVPGTSAQPIEMTYHYMKIAFKKYRPQLVVLGASMFVFHPDMAKFREGFAHMATDPFPLGLDKVRMLRDQHLEDPVENYLFPFLKYHSRWKELRKRDFRLGQPPLTSKSGLFMGFQMNTNICMVKKVVQLDLSKQKSAAVLPEKLEYLDKISELCQSHGVKLLLFNTVRAGVLADGRLVDFHRYAKERNVDFLDLNEVVYKTGLSNKTDFHDTGHLNFRGAEKATRYLGRYIQEHYSLEVCQSPEVREQWDAFCRKYDAVKKSLLSPQKK